MKRLGWLALLAGSVLTIAFGVFFFVRLIYGYDALLACALTAVFTAIVTPWFWERVMR